MAAMTKQEMTRAMTLLEEDDLEELAKIKVGKWAITTENGIYGIYETKSEAIEDALARQMQTRNHAIFQYEEYSSSEARSFQGWQKNKDRIGVVIA